MPDAQTLVVLPLTAGPKTTNLVSQALDAVMDSQGSAILFLNGITRLCILDRVRNQEIVIEKRVRRTPSTDQETAVFSEVTVTVTKSRAATVGSEWRVAEAMFGESESDAALLREVAGTLPGSAWKTVGSSPVAVAVPLATPTVADGGWPLEGRLCIGLPTHDRTGTFAWVHAHFFGTISRKGIDLTEGTFNQLLFKEAVRLHARLLVLLRYVPRPKRNLADVS